MSKKQFNILIAVIISCYILQTLFLFYKFNWAQKYNQMSYNVLLNQSYDIEQIKKDTNNIQEIVTKYINPSK
jgi:uncharacterized protein YxeA